MNYYKHNIGDFCSLTTGMSCELVGVFVRLIDRMMSTEKPIKTQWVSLGFDLETQPKAISILENCFEETEDGYVLPKLFDQIAEYQQNAEKNRINGAKGGRPKKTGTQTKPTGFVEETEAVMSGDPNETLTINHKPLTNIDKEIKKEKPKKTTASKAVKPDDVSEEVWTEWSAHRKRKKASMSDLVIKELRKEAEMAGLSLQEVMTIQVMNGWQGFKASWLTKEGVKGIPSHKGELTQEERIQQGYGYDW